MVNVRVFTAVLIALAMVIIVGVYLGYYGGGHTPTGTTTIGQSPSSTTVSASNAAQKLNDSPFAQYSYRIFPGPLSQQAILALAGFQMQNTTYQNGTTRVAFYVNGAPVENITVQKNYSIYIVETSYGDDRGNYDGSLGDDALLLVNQTGYIV